MHKTLPRGLTEHPALTPQERACFADLDPQELSRNQLQGLRVLLEGILAERVPGFHRQYTMPNDTPTRHGYALCAHLLHENEGFTAQQVTDGRAWLTPLPSLSALLAFFFRLRQVRRDTQLADAKQRAGITH